MPRPIFDEQPIAVIWDFDKTLIPETMQQPLFEHFDVEARDFWTEADGLPAFHRRHGVTLVSDDTLYLNHILSYVRAGKFPGLSNALLRELGSRLEFYLGLPKFFATTKNMVEENTAFAELRIKLEHYIVSTGFRQMILGSAIAEHVDGVWACEFAEQLAPPGYIDDPPPEPDKREIQDIVYTINNTTKTRAVFEINKGVNRDPRINVNAAIAPEDRRVPFENMIYIADGPSDVPVFSIVKRFGGQTYAVYKAGSEAEFAQVNDLSEQGRVDAFGEANYEDGTQTAMWIRRAIVRAATGIVRDRQAEREASLISRVGSPPRHLSKATDAGGSAQDDEVAPEPPPSTDDN